MGCAILLPTVSLGQPVHAVALQNPEKLDHRRVRSMLPQYHRPN